MQILYNARIHTLDAAQPIASVIVIDRERVLAVGQDDLLEQFGTVAEKHDLGGRTVLPGLTDAHIHLQHYALSLRKIDCETDTLAECLRRIGERVTRAASGEWVLGHGWNQNAWEDAPPASAQRVAGFGNASDLDAIAPDHPVYLTAKSLHAAWANSAALRLAGITADTPDPENGKIQRDSQGNPTGILLESAMDLLDQVIPQPGADQVAQAIQEAQPVLWRMGLTGVHDFDRRTCFMALQQLRADGKLRLRVTKSIPVDDLEHAVELGLRSGFGDDWLRIGSVKVFMDGALGPRTAAMIQPYLNDSENFGILNLDGEELFEISRRAAGSGLSMAVHAIGDRANHAVLEAYQQLRHYERENKLPALRHRIEHVQLIHPDDAGRLGELDIIASMQPIHATSDMLMADQFWGERAALSYAWQTQLAHGARLAFGSDAPVESPNPFWGLHAAITRQRADGTPGPDGWYPSQRLDMQAAIEGFTLGPAFTTGMENRLGKLVPGYLADLIVLETDPFGCAPHALLEMESSATMIAGQWVTKL
jgi:predicted amidohydrolase YtcJ